MDISISDSENEPIIESGLDMELETQENDNYNNKMVGTNTVEMYPANPPPPPSAFF